MVSGFSVAGPSVQMIFVFRIQFRIESQAENARALFDNAVANDSQAGFSATHAPKLLDKMTDFRRDYLERCRPGNRLGSRCIELRIKERRFAIAV